MSTRAHPRRRRHRRRLVNKIRAPEERVLNISELFIRRPVMTVALTASVILFGIFAYFRLPVSEDRKSTRLNSSHGYISYAVFCLKKKNTNRHTQADLGPAGAAERRASSPRAVAPPG